MYVCLYFLPSTGEVCLGASGGKWTTLGRGGDGLLEIIGSLLLTLMHL